MANATTTTSNTATTSRTNNNRRVQEKYGTLQRRYRVLRLDDGAVVEKTMVDFIHSNESQYHREVSQLIANDTYKVQFTVRIEFKKTVTDTEDEERKKVWTL